MLTFKPILTLLVAFSAAAPATAPAAAPAKRAEAVFAGGCFWCTESDFDKVPGVISTTSGYTGGKLLDPTYEKVSAGGTGHIEAVRIVYDPSRVTYATLVDHLFRTIDPLDNGGQFCDRGYQYRSAIFVANPAEAGVAKALKDKAAARLSKPVATLILPRRKFYPAEGYHQDYYKKNPIRYRFYRLNCGRDARIKAVWGAAAR
jgi:peptide-methionine (S)-S-oxide reductase